MKQSKNAAKPLDDSELSAQLYLRLAIVLLSAFTYGLYVVTFG